MSSQVFFAIVFDLIVHRLSATSLTITFALDFTVPYLSDLRSTARIVHQPACSSTTSQNENSTNVSQQNTMPIPLVRDFSNFHHAAPSTKTQQQNIWGLSLIVLLKPPWIKTSFYRKYPDRRLKKEQSIGHLKMMRSDTIQIEIVTRAGPDLRQCSGFFYAVFSLIEGGSRSRNLPLTARGVRILRILPFLIGDQFCERRGCSSIR